MLRALAALAFMNDAGIPCRTLIGDLEELAAGRDAQAGGTGSCEVLPVQANM